MSTWTITRELDNGEVFISPNTTGTTNKEVVVSVTSSKAAVITPQYSVDGGSTYTNLDNFQVDDDTEYRSLSPEGVLRFAVGNNYSGKNTVVIVVTVSGSQYVTVDDVYRTTGINSSVVDESNVQSAILRASSEAVLLTGRPLGTESRTEYLYGNNKQFMYLDCYPIVTVSSLSVGGTEVTTSTLDVVTDTGRITLGTDSEVTRFTLPSRMLPESKERNIIVTYTWGYSNPPYWHKRIVECLAGIQVITQQIGGTFDDVTSESLGDYSSSLGEPYVNIRQVSINLKQELDMLLKRYVRKSVAVY